MSYAIISVGGKQYRVQEGQRLLVDRLPHGEGKTFTPAVLLTGGGDGGTRVAPDDVTVTIRVVADVKGEKIRIGKYRPKNGYRKHTGFRASLSQIEVESIGTKKRAPAAAADRKDEAPEPEKRVQGMPAGYEDLTVAQIKEQSSGWNRPMLEAALEYEQGHGTRKGALTAIEAALAEKEA